MDLGNLDSKENITSSNLETMIVYSRFASDWLELDEMNKVKYCLGKIDLSSISECGDLIVKNLIILAYKAFIHKKTDFLNDLLLSIKKGEILFTSEEANEFYSVLILKLIDNPFRFDFSTFKMVINLIEIFIYDKKKSYEEVSLFYHKNNYSTGKY